MLSQGLSVARPHPTVLAPLARPLGPGLGRRGGACVVDFRDSRQEVSLVGGGREEEAKAKWFLPRPVLSFIVFMLNYVHDMRNVPTWYEYVIPLVLHWQKNLAQIPLLGLLCNWKSFFACLVFSRKYEILVSEDNNTDWLTSLATWKGWCWEKEDPRNKGIGL